MTGGFVPISDYMVIAAMVLAAGVAALLFVWWFENAKTHGEDDTSGQYVPVRLQLRVQAEREPRSARSRLMDEVQEELAARRPSRAHTGQLFPSRWGTL